MTIRVSWNAFQAEPEGRKLLVSRKRDFETMKEVCSFLRDISTNVHEPVAGRPLIEEFHNEKDVKEEVDRRPS